MIVELLRLWRGGVAGFLFLPGNNSNDSHSSNNSHSSNSSSDSHSNNGNDSDDSNCHMMYRVAQAPACRTCVITELCNMITELLDIVM